MANRKTLMWGLALGAAAGLAAGLLISPRPGKENRKWLRAHAKDWYSRSRTWWERREGNGQHEATPEEELRAHLVE